MRRRFDANVAHVAAWMGRRGERLQPDRGQAERFLHLLDPNAEWFSFRIFSASPYTRLPGKDPLEQVLQGRLDACWDELRRLNRLGAAIAVTINESDGRGRAQHNITRVRALFVDDDAPARRRRPFSLPPDCSVQSSPGHFHHYWLTRDVPLADFIAAQRRLAGVYQTDSKVCALNQSMSLPGFFWRKDARAAHLVRLNHRFEGARSQPLPADELMASLLAAGR